MLQAWSMTSWYACLTREDGNEVGPSPLLKIYLLNSITGRLAISAKKIEEKRWACHSPKGVCWNYQIIWKLFCSLYDFSTSLMLSSNSVSVVLYNYRGGIAILSRKPAISLKRSKTGPRLLMMTNRKSHTRFRLVLKSMTLDDFEQPLRILF